MRYQKKEAAKGGRLYFGSQFKEGTVYHGEGGEREHQECKASGYITHRLAAEDAGCWCSACFLILLSPGL